jgi:hypothetical protein
VTPENSPRDQQQAENEDGRYDEEEDDAGGRAGPHAEEVGGVERQQRDRACGDHGDPDLTEAVIAEEDDRPEEAGEHQGKL